MWIYPDYLEETAETETSFIYKKNRKLQAQITLTALLDEIIK